jgi:hypothetical protein
MKTILSLFDWTGTWAEPFRRDPDYDVIYIDIKDGMDINDFCYEYCVEELGIELVHGILAAPDCTHFSSSGAQYWPAKDKDGRTDAALELVYQTLRTVELYKPEWWVLENPVGRLNRLIPDLPRPWYFQPHEFGDAYTKKTGIWGRFNQEGMEQRKTPVEPIRACDAGSWLMQLGGKSERTKELRSETPAGFATAFYQAHAQERPWNVEFTERDDVDDYVDNEYEMFNRDLDMFWAAA